MTTNTELTLIAEPAPDGVRLSVRVSDLSIDGSLWTLWPTLKNAIDPDALAAPYEIGSVTVVDGSVDTWQIDERFRVSDETRVPQPPDEHCNGTNDDGELCGLSANWGRDEPIEQNPGRCRYHKDEPIETAPNGGTAIDEVAYGEGRYGGTKSA